MNFAPRDEKPRLVHHVKQHTVGVDVRGVVHYVRDLTILDGDVPCTAAIFAKETPLQPVTCLECLCLNVR